MADGARPADGLGGVVVVAFGGGCPPSEPAWSSVAALPAGRDTPDGGSRLPPELRSVGVRTTGDRGVGPWMPVLGLGGTGKHLDGSGAELGESPVRKQVRVAGGGFDLAAGGVGAPPGSRG